MNVYGISMVFLSTWHLGRVVLGGNLILKEIHTLACLIFIERVDKYSHDSVSLST